MYRSLVSDRIADKIALLCDRIEERFPDSGLGKVCRELHQVSDEAEAACRWIALPHTPLRVTVGFVIALIAAGLIETLLALEFAPDTFALSQFVQVFEASMNAVVLIGAAVLFLVTLETRIKRKRAVTAVTQLRAVAHVIDMHQLTKDPSKLAHLRLQPGPIAGQELTAFELSRYLNYCSEMLSLVGKVAALYAQGLADSVVASEVSDLEQLTTGLSRKIWQKIMVLDLFENRTSQNGPPERVGDIVVP